MSNDEPSKFSRRRFLKGSAAAAGAAATGGSSAAAAAAGSVAKAGAVALPSFKVLDALVKAVNDMGSIIGESGNIDLEGLQASLKGKLVLPRFPENENEYLDKTQNGRIDFSSHKNLLQILKSLPAEKPLTDLLSGSVLKETVGKGSEDFATDPAVKKAMDLKEIIDPLCDAETTSADLIDGFKGYFVKLASHAIKQPKDFVIEPAISDPWGWNPYEIKDVSIRERRYGHDDRGPYDFVAGRNDIGDIIDILENYKKDDESLEPLLNKLKEVNEAWELENKERCVQESNERREKRRQEKQADEEKERAEKDAKERAEREKSLEKAKERTAEKKANPDKRGKFSATLRHIAGDKYKVIGGNKTTAVDWFHWAQSFNADVKPHHVLFEAESKTLTISNIPENAPLLRNVFSSAHGDGQYGVRLLNRRTGIDLNEQSDYQEKPRTSQFGQPEIFLELKTQSLTVNVNEIISGQTVLGIDFSREGLFPRDELTGLNNTAALVDELKNKGKAIGGYHSDSEDVVIMHFDITKFKSFNNQFGPLQGDIALQEVTNRLSKAAEYETVIGRVEGDEFVMIYYGGRQSEEEILSNMKDKLSKSPPLIVTNPEGVNIPIGVAADRASAQIHSFPVRTAAPMPKAA